jgi:hypothetical protein
MAGPTIDVGAPQRPDRAGGIETVVPFITDSRFGIAQDLVFQSDGCEFPELSEHLCYTGSANPADKDFSSIDIMDAIGVPFPLYAGVVCWAGPDADELPRAQAALRSGRGRSIEEQLAIWANQGTIVPGGGIGGSVTGAIALIEQELDDSYVGQGIILMSRADAVRADAEGSLHTDGTRITTINGTPVIASGRVTPGQIFGLGAAKVLESPVEARDVIETTWNKHWALAEAIYAIVVDCEFRIRASTTATAPPAPADITVFTANGTFAAASTTAAFNVTETGATPITSQLQYQDKVTGAWVDMPDPTSTTGGVWTYPFNVATKGFVATDVVHFRLNASNIAGSDSVALNRTVTA